MSYLKGINSFGPDLYKNPRKHLQESRLQNYRTPTVMSDFKKGNIPYVSNRIKSTLEKHDPIDAKISYEDGKKKALENDDNYYLPHVLHVFDPPLGPKYSAKKIDGIYGNEDHVNKMLRLDSIPGFFDENKEIFRKALLHLEANAVSSTLKNDYSLAKKHFVECLCASSQKSTGKHVHSMSFEYSEAEQEVMSDVRKGKYSDIYGFYDPTAFNIGAFLTGKDISKSGQQETIDNLLKLQRTDPKKFVLKTDQLKKDKTCNDQYKPGFSGPTFRAQIGTVYGDDDLIAYNKAVTVQSDVVLTKAVSTEGEELCLRNDAYVDLMTIIHKHAKDKNGVGFQTLYEEKKTAGEDYEKFLKILLKNISSESLPAQHDKIKKLLNESILKSNINDKVSSSGSTLLNFYGNTWKDTLGVIANICGNAVHEEIGKLKEYQDILPRFTLPGKLQGNVSVVQGNEEKNKSEGQNPPFFQVPKYPNFQKISLSKSPSGSQSSLSSMSSNNTTIVGPSRNSSSNSIGSTGSNGTQVVLGGDPNQKPWLKFTALEKLAEKAGAKMKSQPVPSTQANNLHDPSLISNKSTKPSDPSNKPPHKSHNLEGSEDFTKYINRIIKQYSFLMMDQEFPIAPTLFRGPQCAKKFIPGLIRGEIDLTKCDEYGLIDESEKINATPVKPLVEKFAHRRLSEFGHFPINHEHVEGGKDYFVQESQLNRYEQNEKNKYDRSYDYKGTLQERPSKTFYPYPFPLIMQNMKNKIQENENIIQDPNIPMDEKISKMYDFSELQQAFMILPNAKYLVNGVTKENSATETPHGLIFAGYDNNVNNRDARYKEYYATITTLVGQCLKINDNNNLFLKKFNDELILKLDPKMFNERVWLLPGVGFFGEDTGERKDIIKWNDKEHCFDFEVYKIQNVPRSAGKRNTRKHKRKTQKKQKKNKKTTRHLKKRSRRNH